MADATQNLDGKTPVKATPFDAHEQATRGTHVPTQADEALPHAGSGDPYPKVVEHREGSEPGSVDAKVIVNSAEEEKAYREAKAAEKAAAEPAKTA